MLFSYDYKTNQKIDKNFRNRHLNRNTSISPKENLSIHHNKQQADKLG